MIRIPSTSVPLLLCAVVSLSRESGQTQSSVSVKLEIKSKETGNFMQNIIAMHSQFQYKYTPCYKQFLPGMEEPEESADAEK